MTYFTDKQYEILLNRLKNGIDSNINKIFNSVIEKMSIQLSFFNEVTAKEILHKSLVTLRREITNNINAELREYTDKSISLSGRKNEAQITAYVLGLTVPKKQIDDWVNAKFKVNIKELSKRVWKLTDNYFTQIEILTNAGLFSGLPAIEIAKELRGYLRDPNRLDKSEIDNLLAKGKINKYQYNHLLNKIVDYRPGRGVYKSSLKNSYRLARTEINTAYRKNDYEVRSQLPFVKGIEVKLSSDHPRFDICDDLAGKYPKDFVFIGWHPHCICYTTAILMTKTDFAKQLAGEDVKVNEVQKMPKKAETYIKERAAKINKMKTTPFFIQENKKYYKDLL